jgi:hypothetical protein
VQPDAPAARFPDPRVRRAMTGRMAQHSAAGRNKNRETMEERRGIIHPGELGVSVFRFGSWSGRSSCTFSLFLPSRLLLLLNQSPLHHSFSSTWLASPWTPPPLTDKETDVFAHAAPSILRIFLALPAHTLILLSLFGFHDDGWIQRITAKARWRRRPDAFRTGTETV